MSHGDLSCYQHAIKHASVWLPWRSLQFFSGFLRSLEKRYFSLLKEQFKNTQKYCATKKKSFVCIYIESALLQILKFLETSAANPYETEDKDTMHLKLPLSYYSLYQNTRQRSVLVKFPKVSIKDLEGYVLVIPEHCLSNHNSHMERRVSTNGWANFHAYLVSRNRCSW